MRATFDAYAGAPQLLFAFEAAVIGGAGSVWGTLFGGIALGVGKPRRLGRAAGLPHRRAPRLLRRAVRAPLLRLDFPPRLLAAFRRQPA